MAALQQLGVLDALNTGPPTKTMIARGFRKIVCALKGRWLVSIDRGTRVVQLYIEIDRWSKASPRDAVSERG